MDVGQSGVFVIGGRPAQAGLTAGHRAHDSLSAYRAQPTRQTKMPARIRTPSLASTNNAGGTNDKPANSRGSSPRRPVAPRTGCRRPVRGSRLEEDVALREPSSAPFSRHGVERQEAAPRCACRRLSPPLSHDRPRLQPRQNCSRAGSRTESSIRPVPARRRAGSIHLRRPARRLRAQRLQRQPPFDADRYNAPKASEASAVSPHPSFTPDQNSKRGSVGVRARCASCVQKTGQTAVPIVSGTDRPSYCAFGCSGWRRRMCNSRN